MLETQEAMDKNLLSSLIQAGALATEIRQALQEVLGISEEKALKEPCAEPLGRLAESEDRVDSLNHTLNCSCVLVRQLLQRLG